MVTQTDWNENLALERPSLYNCSKTSLRLTRDFDNSDIKTLTVVTPVNAQTPVNDESRSANENETHTHGRGLGKAWPPIS